MVAENDKKVYAQPIRGMGRKATGPLRFFTFTYHLVNICWGLFLWARALESSSRGASLLKRSPRLLGWGSWKRGAVIIQWEWWRRGKRLVNGGEVVPVWKAKSTGERDCCKHIAWWVSERKSMWIRSEAPTSAYRHELSVGECHVHLGCTRNLRRMRWKCVTEKCKRFPSWGRWCSIEIGNRKLAWDVRQGREQEGVNEDRSRDVLFKVSPFGAAVPNLKDLVSDGLGWGWAHNNQVKWTTNSACSSHLKPPPPYSWSVEKRSSMHVGPGVKKVGWRLTLTEYDP